MEKYVKTFPVTASTKLCGVNGGSDMFCCQQRCMTALLHCMGVCLWLGYVDGQIYYKELNADSLDFNLWIIFSAILQPNILCSAILQHGIFCIQYIMYPITKFMSG